MLQLFIGYKYLMNKYSLTGHTRGIGKCLYDRLSPNVIGFSKSTGYDITLKKDRQRIIDESIDCDIFINNAHCGFGQTELLIDLFHVWKNLPKVIINVGSNITNVILPESRLELLRYATQKKSLKLLVDDTQGYICDIRYKNFGYVGTENILKKYPNFTEKDYITIEEAARLIIS